VCKIARRFTASPCGTGAPEHGAWRSRQAAHADFNLLLSGHTHGGQICLPGDIPIALDSVLPRFMGSGAWKYHDMISYTSLGAGSSVVPVRFNSPPEITLHHFHLSS
jgi:uncharacterized protein